MHYCTMISRRTSVDGSPGRMPNTRCATNTIYVPTRSVLDLGGFQGCWAAEIFVRYGCPVHVFEPVAENRSSDPAPLCRNPCIHVHPFGLSNANCTTTLGLQGDASSHWKSSLKSCRSSCATPSPFSKKPISRGVLCKINIEARVGFLEHLLDAQVIQRFRNLQIQFHTFVPQATERMEAAPASPAADAHVDLPIQIRLGELATSRRSHCRVKEMSLGLPHDY